MRAHRGELDFDFFAGDAQIRFGAAREKNGSRGAQTLHHLAAGKGNIILQPGHSSGCHYDRRQLKL